MTWSPWARAYADTPDTYVWGTRPSRFARAVSAHLPPGARILDLGCGEGRDSVFFASCGFQVIGVDPSAAGLAKAERLARARGVAIDWVDADAATWAPPGLFDLVYSCGALHYVARRQRGRLISRLQAATQPGGHHALVVFTDLHIYAEHGERIDYFATGELGSAYAEWRIVRSERGMIACARDGRSHRHSVEWLMARKSAVRQPASRAGRLWREPSRAIPGQPA